MATSQTKADEEKEKTTGGIANTITAQSSSPCCAAMWHLVLGLSLPLHPLVACALLQAQPLTKRSERESLHGIAWHPLCNYSRMHAHCSFCFCPSRDARPLPPAQSHEHLVIFCFALAGLGTQEYARQKMPLQWRWTDRKRRCASSSVELMFQKRAAEEVLKYLSK